MNPTHLIKTVLFSLWIFRLPWQEGSPILFSLIPCSLLVPVLAIPVFSSLPKIALKTKEYYVKILYVSSIGFTIPFSFSETTFNFNMLGYPHSQTTSLFLFHLLFLSLFSYIYFFLLRFWHSHLILLCLCIFSYNQDIGISTYIAPDGKKMDIILYVYIKDLDAYSREQRIGFFLFVFCWDFSAHSPCQWQSCHKI